MVRRKQSSRNGAEAFVEPDGGGRGKVGAWTLGGAVPGWLFWPIIALDVNTVWETIIEQPTQFGLSDTTDEGVLASNATGYLFWDDVHPTTQVQHLIEQFAVRYLLDYFSPSRGKGQPPAEINSLNGLVRFALRGARFAASMPGRQKNNR